jgi:hypothetical protein
MALDLTSDYTPSVTIVLTPMEAGTLYRILKEAMQEARVSPTEARMNILGVLDSLEKAIADKS